MTPAPALLLEPLLGYPREAEIGKTYLLTVDLRSVENGGAWPYPQTEEVTIYCFVDAGDLFRSRAFGEPAVVLHRFGGTYGPARFLLTPEPAERKGKIRVTLANGWGVPMGVIETGEIQVSAHFERRPEPSTVYLEAPAVEGSDEAARPAQAAAVPADPDVALLVTYLEKVRVSRSRLEPALSALAPLLEAIGASVEPRMRLDLPANRPSGWVEESGYRARRGAIRFTPPGEDSWIVSPLQSPAGPDFLPMLVTNLGAFELVTQASGEAPKRAAAYRLAASEKEFLEAIQRPRELAARHAAPFLKFLREALVYDARGAKDDYALVTGIGHNPGLSPLPEAVEDARSFAAWVADPAGGGLPAEHVGFLDSPSLAAFDERLESVVEPARQGTKGRRLYFYIAGQAASSGEEILVFTPSANLGEHIAVREYLRMLEGVGRFEEIVMICDCRQTVNRWMQPRKPAFVAPPKIPSMQAARSVAFLRAGFDGRGALTRVLLTGLRGGAATRDGVITTESLSVFVRRRLTTQEAASTPRPTVLQTGRAFVLRESVPVTPIRVRIIVPPNRMGQLRITDESDLPLPIVEADKDPVEVLLMPGRYTVEHVASHFRLGFELEPGQDTFELALFGAAEPPPAVATPVSPADWLSLSSNSDDALWLSTVEEAIRKGPALEDSRSDPLLLAAAADLRAGIEGHPPSTPDALCSYNARMSARSSSGPIAPASTGCDPRWTDIAKRYRTLRERRQSIPYRPPAGGVPIPMPSQARVALLGSWGTGTPAAQQVIRQVAQMSPHVAIHLGGIYYSGTSYEVEERFYQPWTSALPPGKVSSFALCGEHELYSGGEAYYEMVGRLGQPASSFCLQNDFWQILAIDTAVNSLGPQSTTFLEPAEQQWLAQQISAAGARRTLLLSYHHLFSALSGYPLNGTLLSQLTPLLPSITAWFWADELNLNIYHPYMGVLARCAGNSGLPRTPVPPTDLNAQVPLSYCHQGSTGELVNLTYTILDLNGPSAQVSYYENRQGSAITVYTETLGGPSFANVA